MRVFIAVELPPLWREELWQAGQALVRLGVRGRFTRQENYHLTLAFLGEVSRPEDVAAIMDRVELPAFSLLTTRAGRFVSRDGEIWWMGVAPHPGLLSVQARLCRALEEAGFFPDKKAFSPHLTVARKVLAPKGMGPEALSALLPSMETAIRSVTLMRSKLLPSGPVYTPLHRTPLR